MRNRIILLVVGLVCLASINSANAQGGAGGVLSPKAVTGFLLGPVGGINIVAYNSDAFPILNSEPTCFTAQNGHGVAAWGGFTVEAPLNSAMQNFIIGEVIYDSKNASFTAQNGSVATTPTKFNGKEVDGSVDTKLTADLSYLLVNLAYKYNFVEGPTPVGPGIQIGPSVGLKLTSKFNKTVTITAAPTPSAPSGSETVTQPTDISGAQSIRIGIRGQVTYDVPFNESWVATPTVGIDFPVTKVDDSRNWRAQGFYAGIAIRYLWKAF